MLDIMTNDYEELGALDSELKDIFSALLNEKGIGPDDVAVIADFPNYVVTREGEVYYLRGKHQKLAKVKPTDRSHPTVNLVGTDGVRKGKLLSRIVAVAFISSPLTPSHRVFHRDGNTRNHHVDNLYWSSMSPAKESQMIRSGTKTLSHAILDEEEVLSVYQLLLKNETLRVIGNKYGVTPQTIQMIRDGLTWKHIITKDMLFRLRGIVNNDNLSIKQYIMSRTGDKDVRQVPNDAYSGIDISDTSVRKIMITESGNVFSINKVSPVDMKKFSIDTSYALVSWLHAKKTVTVSGKPFLISNLIAYTFHGTPSKDQYLNHKDGDVKNIHKDNLEWVNYRVGRLNGRGRSLTVPQVRNIKEMLRENIAVKDISEKFNVSRSAVYKIKNKESWSWV
jgi:hypothetical protein